MKKLMAMLKALFAKLFGKAPTPDPTPSVPPEAPPRVVPTPVTASKTLHKGVWYALTMPLNPAYEPGLGEVTFGGAHLGGQSWIAEDRLSRPVGARSPAGFPTWEGRVRFGGELYPNDAEIAARIFAVGERDAGLAAWQAAFDAERFYGPVPATSLSLEDAAYLYAMSAEYRGQNNRDLFRAVLSGSNREIAQQINRGEQAFIEINTRDTTFALTYAGPVRAAVYAAFAAAGIR